MKRALLFCLALGLVSLGQNAVGPLPSLQIPNPLQAQTKPASIGSPSFDPILAISDRFESIAAKVLPAVVSVEAVKPAKITATNSKGRPVEESGSGVIIKSELRAGYVVITNNHVISQAPNDQITIHLADGRVVRPSKVWTDPETDIALMAIESSQSLPHATLGNSDNVRVGRWVLAMGSPFGLNQTVTHGIISARDRGQVSLGNTIRIKDFLQTDAAINPGSSGGPLVDMNGEIIGINTAIASHNGSNSGVAFSIPANLVKRVIQQMLSQGVVQRGYLGMQLALAFEPNDALKLGLDRVQGALVERVYPETPAAVADLRVQDVILQIDQIPVRNENHLINMISSLPAGQKIRLQIWRNRETVALEATVGDWNKAQTRFKVEP